jgi:hypothetical protein
MIIVGNMRVTLKAVNEKLADLGTKAELAKGAGYFLFRGGEADDWIDRTIAVPTENIHGTPFWCIMVL